MSRQLDCYRTDKYAQCRTGCHDGWVVTVQIVMHDAEIDCNEDCTHEPGAYNPTFGWSIGYHMAKPHSDMSDRQNRMIGLAPSPPCRLVACTQAVPVKLSKPKHWLVHQKKYVRILSVYVFIESKYPDEH